MSINHVQRGMFLFLQEAVLAIEFQKDIHVNVAQ